MTDAIHPPPFEAPPPERLAPLFPGYTIEGLIATGGMGAVYKAVQISLDRPVAIKILPREFGQDEEFRANFTTEARTMARLNHPNLIGVYDFGEVDGMLFIVMEFVPGKTLFHSAHGKIIAQDEAARIVAGVCLALAHAHEHKILHRDIKPGNILLDQQARPKIGDFGLARPIGAAVGDGETIFGTPHYTAPEVLKSPNRVDARADIFSVGVILHELLTGRLPAEDPRPASAITGTDPRFDAVIRRATHPSPDLRYASATDMAREIEAIATNASTGPARLRPGGPAVALPNTGIPRPAHATKVHLKSSAAGNLAGMVATIAVLTAIGVALFIVTRPNPELARTTPATPAAPLASTAIPSAQAPTSKQDPPAPQPIGTSPAPTADPSPAPDPQTAATDPRPEPDPASTPEPGPERATSNQTTPAPAPLPVFDVPNFLERARTLTRQRASTPLENHAKEMAKNFEAFERRVSREVRDLDRISRNFAENRLNSMIAEWKADGNRLPDQLELPERGLAFGRNEAFIDSLTEIHADFLEKQKKIDDQLETTLLEIANSFYLLGLRKQVERLTDPNESPSVDAIETEISAVQDDIGYFTALMRGEKPVPATPKNGED